MLPHPRIALPLVLSCCFFAVSPRDDSEVVRGETGERLDEYLSGLEGVGFSGVVGVLAAGETVLVKGYGQADREAGRPVTTDTVFSVGSITKQFTATAILLLEDQGRLDVQASITDYFANVPPDKQGITLHHLLTHGAGLASGYGDDWDLEATDEWVLAQALTQPLRSEPGTRYHYSNAGYSLLGMIVERVSGQGYEAFLQEHLFAPAGMKSTGYFAPEFGERVAIGYDQGRRWGTVLERPMLADGPCWNLRANGGIHSTVGDMLRWHQALEGDAILSPEAKAKLYGAHMDEGGGQSFYGYGWSIRNLPDRRRLIAHNGGNGILFADFLRYPDDDVVIFLATNVAQDFSAMTRPVRAVVFDEPFAKPPATLALDASFTERYVGRYPLDDESTFAIERRGDAVFVVGEGAGAAEILNEDPQAQELRAVSGEITTGLLTGAFEPFHEWNDAERPRKEVEAGLQRWRSDLLAAHGEFTGVGVIAVRTGRSARSFVEARFSAGSAYVILGWRNGRIDMLDVSAEPPWPAGRELRVFPFSTTEFGTFSLGSGSNAPEHRVRFELDDTGRAVALILDSELGAVAAYRE